MEKRQRILPDEWLFCVICAAAAGIAGNFLIRILPWPAFMLESFRPAAETSVRGGSAFLVAALLAGPLAEEAVFRSGIYGFLRPRLGTRASAFCSALAFGLYHGNWIQGIYGFMMGILLAWGYERSRYRKYAVVVLMHGAANLAALAVFG